MTGAATPSWRADARSRGWAAFGRWRQVRPFWGGLLLVLAAVEMLVSSNLDLFNRQIHLGPTGFLSYVIPLILGLCGIFAWLSPGQRLFYGILGVVTAVYSLIGLNLGGFGLGLLLGVVGGSLSVAWTPSGSGRSAQAGSVAADGPTGVTPADTGASADGAGVPEETDDGIDGLLDPEPRSPGAPESPRSPGAPESPRSPEAPESPRSPEGEGPESAAPPRPRRHRRTGFFAVALLWMVVAVPAVGHDRAEAGTAVRSGAPGVAADETTEPSPPSPATPDPPTHDTPAPTTPAPTTPAPTTPASGPTTPGEPTSGPGSPTPSASGSASPGVPGVDPVSPGAQRPEPTVAPAQLIPADAGQPPVNRAPSKMLATVLTMDGLSYRGVVDLPTAGGTIRALLFSMRQSVSTSFDLQVAEKDRQTSIKADSLTVGGDVRFYASRFQGLLLGLFPTTYTPDAPPLLTVPDVFFTNADIDLVYVQANSLTSKHMTITAR